MTKIKDLITIISDFKFDYHTISELKEITSALEQFEKIEPKTKEEYKKTDFNFKEFALTLYKDRPVKGEKIYELYEISEDDFILNKRTYQMEKGKLKEL